MDPTQKSFALSTLVLLAAAWWSAQSLAAESPPAERGLFVFIAECDDCRASERTGDAPPAEAQ